MATARKTTAQRTSAAKTAPAFTDEEKSAMKERAKEVKAAKSGTVDDTTAVLDKIAEMEGDDRALAEQVHQVIIAAAPDLEPRLWYGMPAYAKGGKTCASSSRQEVQVPLRDVGLQRRGRPRRRRDVALRLRADDPDRRRREEGPRADRQGRRLTRGSPRRVR